jgi:hypothetical protein
MDEEQSEIQVDHKIVAEALDVGWKPLDKYKGPPENWVGPEEYLERAQHLMPVLRANNEKLKGELTSVRQANEALKSSVEEMRRNMTEFSKAQTELLKEKLAEQRASLIAARKEARDEGDAVREARLEDAIEENRGKTRALEAAPAPAPAPAAPVVAPELQAWMSENPWFGKDKRKTAIAMAAAQEAQEEGLTAPAAVIRRIDAVVAEMFPGASGGADKTEGGGPSGRGAGSGGGGGSGFASLPPEAKAQARRDAARFVGKDKMFKTEAEWNTYFAEQYNSVN